MTAPSFSSFPDLNPGPSKSKEAVTTEKSKSKNERKHKKDRKGQDGARDEGRRRKTREPPTLDQFEEQVLRHSGGTDKRPVRADDGELIFYSDRKGDALNVRYGGLNADDVAKYHLVARGRKILGLGGDWTAVYRTARTIEVAPGSGSKRKTPRITDSSSRALLNAPPTRRVLTSTNPYKYPEEDGFLRLPSRRGHALEHQSYRSITQDKPPNSDSESSASEEDSGDDSDTTPLTAQQETTRSLERAVKSNPSSVSAWMAVLDHTLSTIPVTFKNASQARAEITLAVIGRAFSAYPHNPSSAILRLKQLRAGEEIWQEGKLHAEWEEALREVPGVRIWLEWLGWRTRKGKGGISRLVLDGVRAMGAMGSSEEAEISKLKLFWRLAVVIHQAGYVERAIALFQAQAELMFNVPGTVKTLPLEKQLDALEEFWESEAPRMGDDGALGWSVWVAQGYPEFNASDALGASPLTSIDAPADPYLRWHAQETHADRHMRTPTRSFEDSEDPYSTILFSDIRPLLCSLQSSAAKEAFRWVWLDFLELPVPGYPASLGGAEDDVWCHLHLASSKYLWRILPAQSADHKRIGASSFAGVIMGQEKEYVSSSFGPIKDWGLGVMGPLESVDGRKEACCWGAADVEGVNGEFVKRVFGQLRRSEGDAQWDAYALAFEAASSVKEAIKSSKVLLAAAQDSIPHWAAHARLERIRGKAGGARKIYETVLLAPSLSRETAEMWWDWAEMEWMDARNEDVTLKVILRSAGVEGDVHSGVVILRARKELESAIATRTDWKLREAWIKLRGLLELLASSVNGALAVFDNHLALLQPATLAHESLTIASLLLLYRRAVILKTPTPPAILRERVSVALQVYPSNALVLGMFLEGEKGRGIWGGIRGMLGETSGADGRQKNVARRVEEVWIAAGWERGRWDEEKERTRSGLAAAIDSDRTRFSPIIWRVFMEFEIRANQLERAKRMLFRAIGECPLSKDLYLLAFGPLRSVFTPRELNSFADTMAEREVRMRVGLEDLLEGWIDPTSQRGVHADDSGDSEDEITHNARELRRLQPYR